MLPEQDTIEWLDARREGIGGSDAGVIMGITPKKWGTKYKTYLEKLGVGARRVTTEAMKRGKALEPMARQAFIVKSGINMTPKMVWSQTHYFMFASLDGLSDCGKFILETKAPGRDDHAEAKAGRVPAKYKAQLQHYLAVGGYECCYYVSYAIKEGVTPQISEAYPYGKPEDFEIVTVIVKADEVFQERLIEEEGSFWKNHVEKFIPPEMEKEDYEQKEGDEWEGLVSKYLLLDKEIKDKTKEKEEARELIIGLCGSTNSRGAGVKVTRVAQPGRIDYTKIEALKGIDLERYRKDPIEYWQITKEKSEVK